MQTFATFADLKSAVADELDYDPETGVFTWKVSGRGRFKRAGAVAGCLSPVGYIHLCIGGRQYLAHRLAWIAYHGTEPPDIIDHIDRNKSNNAIANLRDGTGGINEMNAKPPKDSPFGISGVRPACKDGHYQAYSNSGGRFKSFYTGPDFFEACCARKSWEAKYWEARQ